MGREREEATLIPSAWVGIVLALAAFRLTRLAGWDDFPPILAARAWATGANQRRQGRAVYADDPTYYRRPLLTKFLHCAWCVGFWVSVAVYVAWVFAPTEALYGAAPFAISAAVGLIAKNLDP
jgi:hypothetical protein